jgi:cytochrome c553
MKVASSNKLIFPALAIAIGCSVASPPGSEEQSGRGAALFQVCAQCHGPEGGGNAEYLSPAIGGLPAWYVEAQLTKFKSGVRGTHPEDVAGLRMRPMSLTLPTDEDVAVVAAYVASLEPARPEPTLGGGDPARGATFFEVCKQCHGPDAAGNPQLFAPPLYHASDWYLLAQLKKFRAGIRGANPADQTGILMRPMSLTLPDEQALKDVIAYIKTLPTQTSRAP